MKIKLIIFTSVVLIGLFLLIFLNPHESTEEMDFKNVSITTEEFIISDSVKIEEDKMLVSSQKIEFSDIKIGTELCDIFTMYNIPQPSLSENSDPSTDMENFYGKLFLIKQSTSGQEVRKYVIEAGKLISEL